MLFNLDDERCCVAYVATQCIATRVLSESGCVHVHASKMNQRRLRCDRYSSEGQSIAVSCVRWIAGL